jgi:nucleoside permease NupC
MMASMGDLDNSETVLVFAIFILCSVFVYICLLNVLIASVASVYSKIEETQELQHMRELAHLISDCREFPLIRYFLKQKKR